LLEVGPGMALMPLEMVDMVGCDGMAVVSSTGGETDGGSGKTAGLSVNA
jgi:hypothetical protein